MIRHLLLMGCFLMIAGCGTPPPIPIESDLIAVSPVPATQILDDRACAIASQPAQYTPSQVIAALDALLRAETACPGVPDATANLEVAYLRYAARLENTGLNSRASRAYEEVLRLNPQNAVASAGMARLEGTQTAATLQPCNTSVLAAARASLPAYTARAGTFITLDNQSILQEDQPFVIHGVHYEPLKAPGLYFYSQAEIEQIDAELNLIREAGFNTLRFPVRSDALFQCPGSGAIPIPTAFLRLDALLQSARRHGLYVILVLHEHPDLTMHPLYTAPNPTQPQMVYLAQRYATEPAILAWDLRQGGDADYRGEQARFSQEQVLDWLSASAALMRQHAPNHLLTASWFDNASETAPIVDFVSFLHFDDLPALEQELANLRAQTSKPLVLASVGYPIENGDDVQQRDQLYAALYAAAANNVQGWVVYTAFDHPGVQTCPPAHPCLDGAGRFGLWNTSAFPKPALEAVQRLMTTDES